MLLRIIDAHTHVHFEAYGVDREEVIKRALQAGIGMVNVGTDKKASARALSLAEKYQGIWATVGLHPIHTSPSFHDEDEGADAPETEFDFEYYLKLAKHPKVVAIGECGFDYFHLPADLSANLSVEALAKSEASASAEAVGEGGQLARQRQKEAFLAQIRLAKEVGKPLMLHCRSGASGNAYRDMIDVLKAESLKLKAVSPGITHFFSGTAEEAKELLELGFYFTFGGAITLQKKPGGADFEALVKMMPEERILAETDAPYVAPLKYRGKRNEPLYIEEVVKKLAELRGVPVGEMERITLENTKKVFNL